MKINDVDALETHTLNAYVQMRGVIKCPFCDFKLWFSETSTSIISTGKRTAQHDVLGYGFLLTVLAREAIENEIQSD